MEIHLPPARLTRRVLTLLAALLTAGLLLAGVGGFWYVLTKLPERSGQVALTGLSAPVSVRYDERGVPPHQRRQ
jgi:penicillin amidase